MSNLRSRIIRLAYQNPEMRPELLPLLEESAPKEAAAHLVRSGMSPHDAILAVMAGAQLARDPGYSVEEG